MPVSVTLTIVGTSYECSHTMCVVLCLAYFTKQSVFKVHPCYIIIRISFFSKAGEYSIVRIYHTLFMWLSVDENLGCFHLLKNMNNAVMNISVQVCVWVTAFNSFGSKMNLSCSIADSMVIPRLTLWWTTNGFPQWPHHFPCPPAMYQGSNFATFSWTPSIFCFVFLYNSHSTGRKVASHCGFDLHFLNEWRLNFFSWSEFLL